MGRLANLPYSNRRGDSACMSCGRSSRGPQTRCAGKAAVAPGIGHALLEGIKASVRSAPSLTEAKCWAVRFPVGRGRPAPTEPNKNPIGLRKILVRSERTGLFGM